MTDEQRARIRELALTQPDAAEGHARALAKARGVEYVPGEPVSQDLTQANARIQELITEWENRGTVARTGRHLEALPHDRPSVRRVAGI